MMMMMTSTMKKPVVLVVCTLLFSALAVLASQSSTGPSECCFRYFPKRLPKDNVMSYRYTHTRCALDAVIFTMKNGDKICVNPALDWVKKGMRAVDSKAKPAKVEGSGI